MKNILTSLYKGILAGLSIGLGGFLFCLTTWGIEGEIGKVLGSIVFAVGLFLVCTFGFYLFTGRVGQVFEEKKDKDFYISLVVMIIGNAIGAIIMGYLGYFIFKNTSLINRAMEVSALRLNFDSYQNYISCFIKSCLCGLCVYMAVKSFSLNKLKPIGIFLLVFFVFVFVYSGFEHCIANMFYFSFSNDWGLNAFIDLGLCITGNIVGTVPGVMIFKLASSKN